MKPVTSQLKTLLLNSNELTAVPKLTAEWEHNRFSALQPITVTPAQATDLDWSAVYSLESIGKPNRPSSGIAKARFDPKLTAGKYRDTPASSRFYLPGEDDFYKYWSSTQKSSATKTGSEYLFATPIVLTLLYTDPVVANKIVVGFEKSYAAPKSFSVQVTTNGTTWGPSINMSADGSGQLVLWRDDAGNWNSVKRFDGATALKGIRVTVSSMDSPNAHLDVIQMGLRLEDDLTDFVESYEKSFEISDRSLIAPVGKASSNGGSVTLSNIDGRFNNENESSYYFGLLGKRARFTIELSYDATPTGTNDERIRELTMWTDEWGGGDQTSVTVALVDSSVILQEIPMPRVFWTDMTVGAIIWQAMDIIGLSNYFYSRSVLDTGQLIPYFYPETDKTVWETLSDLSEGTQTAIYFDEYDILQIKTRKSLFSAGRPVDWNLDAIQNGQKLPDVIDASQESAVVVNKVDVNYKPAKYSDFANGFPKMETVWEPTEDAVTLRSSPLIKDFKAADTAFWIRQADAEFWPFKASVDIRGEVISYEGKEYAWHGTDHILHYDIVKAQEDKVAIDAKSDLNLAWSNSFTGKMIVTGRGVNGSIKTDHLIRPAAYTGSVTNFSNTRFAPAAGGMLVSNGILTVSPPVSLAINDMFKIQPEAVVSSNGTNYGFKFRFPTSQLRADHYSTGGMFFAGDWGDTGYYLEISTTETIDAIEKRTWRHEIRLLAMPSNGAVTVVPSEDPKKNSLLGGDGVKGFKSNIVTGQWYRIDLRHSIEVGTNNALINVFLDGVLVGGFRAPTAQRPTDQGKFGLYVRSMCKMDVEYLYAVNSDPSADAIDQSTFLDIVDGGYASGYIDRQWRYGPQYLSKNRGPAREGSYWFTALNNRANYFLDEYGPVVHELREFEVTFDADKSPVSHSYLYLSNDSKAVCTNYWADAFGAKFTLANTSRENAIMKGDDNSLGESNTIHQQMFVYGRSLYQTDGQTVTKTDDASIRANGAVNLQIDSRFIETDTAANDIGQWVVDQWAAGSDEQTVNVFGNPLLQLGDLVTMNFPLKGMYPATHKYWVVDINNSFTTGLETKLILRRART